MRTLFPCKIIDEIVKILYNTGKAFSSKFGISQKG